MKQNMNLKKSAIFHVLVSFFFFQLKQILKMCSCLTILSSFLLAKG